MLVAEAATADYFEEVASGRDAKQAANWVINDLFGLLGKAGKGIEDSPVSAAGLGKLLDLLKSEVISGRIAKDVFAIMFETGSDPEAIVEERGLKQVTDTAAIEAMVDRADRGEPGPGRRRAEEPQGRRLVHRPGDEGHRRQGQPGRREPAGGGEARPVEAD